MKPIYLVAVGPGIPRHTMEWLAFKLAESFRVSCHLRDEMLDATRAFDPRREQYYSSVILQTLQKLADGARILGVTEFDLFVPVLTFVFGEAQLGGDCALVSLHRLHEEFYGLPPRDDLLHERLMKEAIHELGHTCGLRHCIDWQCVMASSHAVERLDVKSAQFCTACHSAVFRFMESPA